MYTFFFFKQKTAYEMRISDWSSDVCSSDLEPIDPDLVKLLIDAYNAAKRDERGFVSLNDLGRRAGNRSSFDARSYGFSRLAELINVDPNFQAARRDGQTFVKRAIGRPHV